VIKIQDTRSDELQAEKSGGMGLLMFRREKIGAEDRLVQSHSMNARLRISGSGFKPRRSAKRTSRPCCTEKLAEKNNRRRALSSWVARIQTKVAVVCQRRATCPIINGQPRQRGELCSEGRTRRTRACAPARRVICFHADVP